jgi:hypothetical protein
MLEVIETLAEERLKASSRHRSALYTGIPRLTLAPRPDIRRVMITYDYEWHSESTPGPCWCRLDQLTIIARVCNSSASERPTSLVMRSREPSDVASAHGPRLKLTK